MKGRLFWDSPATSRRLRPQIRSILDCFGVSWLDFYLFGICDEALNPIRSLLDRFDHLTPNWWISVPPRSWRSFWELIILRLGTPITR
ncbi:uncharacterized protein LOC126799502 isoform X2 [Argentina anserina]|uniref:uncharacterized protein LOC126799502 isoform X2 n=1 Tax=Argentina anserina TaxID=57926 RepID=UPI0021763FB3|nr:uncharacterized protein LOC126799502 isoform X2 [Potentilla anserina]